MLRKITLAITALMIVTSGPSFAAERCRDAKGKFVKCATTKVPAPSKCKDAKGKFAKCGTPGATQL